MEPIPAELVDAPDIDLEVVEAHIIDDPRPASEVAAEIVAAQTDGDTIAPWRCDTLDAAEWLLRKVGAADREVAEVRRQATEWRQRIDEWEDDAVRRPEARRAWAVAHLTVFALAERAAGRKSVTLPSGKVSTRQASKPTVRVADPDVFVQWAKASLSEAEQAMALTAPKPLVSGIRTLVHAHEIGGAIVVEHGGEEVPGLVAEWVEPTVQVVAS